MKAPRIKVGFVLHKMHVAGAEMLVARLIRSSLAEIDATIYCLDGIGQMGEELLAEDIPVISLDRQPGRDWKVAWKLAKEIQLSGIQVVHAHQYTPFFYAALAKARIANAFRLILTEHGRHYPDIVSPKRRGFNRLVLDRQADAINACCGFSAKALSQKDGFTGNRIEVIENGIDPGQYNPRADKIALRQQLGLPVHQQLVSCVARFHPVKDHAMLIEAFGHVCKERTDTDLILAGGGPLRAELEQQCQRLNISQRVHFLGVRSDVPKILEASDVFTLTSLSEAASLTVLEAMACGLPVVVTDVGGNPEMVRDEVDGLLVPRGDANACAEALLYLLEEPEERQGMGENARKRVEETYTFERTRLRYLKLYHSLAGGKKAAKKTKANSTL